MGSREGGVKVFVGVKEVSGWAVRVSRHYKFRVGRRPIIFIGLLYSCVM